MTKLNGTGGPLYEETSHTFGRDGPCRRDEPRLSQTDKKILRRQNASYSWSRGDNKSGTGAEVDVHTRSATVTGRLVPGRCVQVARIDILSNISTGRREEDMSSIVSET